MQNNLINRRFHLASKGYQLIDMTTEYSEEIRKTIELDHIDAYIRETDKDIETRPYLVPIENDPVLDSYNLNDRSAAFIEFASLSDRESNGSLKAAPSFKKANEFANKYGLLNDLVGLKPESILFWMIESEKMGFVYRIYNAIKSSDISTLKHFIPYNESKDKYLVKEYIPLSNLNEKEPYRYREVLELNKPIKSITAAAWNIVSLYSTMQLRNVLSGYIRPNDYNTGASMELVPNNLLSGLWLQFANTITNNLEFKQCPECLNYFEVKAKKRNIERMYCTSKCNKRASSRRRREREKEWIVACAKGYKGTLTEFIAELKEKES